MTIAHDLQAGDPSPASSTIRAGLLRATRRSLKFVRRAEFSRDILRVIDRVAAALETEGIASALRHLDRAWRTSPEIQEVLAGPYGGVLTLESRDFDAVLRVVDSVTRPTADLAALSIHALLRLQRPAEARHRLETALNDFCVVTDELLALTASEWLRQSDHSTTGWIGRTANLEFVGELIDFETTSSLQVRLDTGAAFAQPIKTTSDAGRHSFHFKLAKVAAEARLTISTRAGSLLGGTCRANPAFALDGRVSSTGTTINGWARINWLGEPVSSLAVEDELGGRVELRGDAATQSGFSIDPRQLELRGSRLTISALLPDGVWHALPGMPVLLDRAIQLRDGSPRALAEWVPSAVGRAPKGVALRRPGIEIVIPVYRGRRETLDCINAAIATRGDARIVVVDDATEDAVLAAALDDFEAAGQITLLRNRVNLGFVGAVNRALERPGKRDVVLLNSDAVVFGDWLARLQNAAYAAPNIGTVTPFSNSGSIASYPRSSDENICLEDAAELNRLATTTHSGTSLEIPVGVGFCLYVRRKCLEDTGTLDAAVFGQGYGEETDFCLRARLRGWTHRLAADVFVYHAGGRSFGSQRDALLHRSQRLINLRHPGYDAFIADYLAKDPLLAIRCRLDEKRLLAFEGKFVLLVALARTGGVARFVSERCRAIRGAGMFPLLLRPAMAGKSERCELWTDGLTVPNLVYEVPENLAPLTDLLRGLSIASIEIQHFLDVDARVIDIVRGLGIPYDVSVHDYAWICPRVTLIDHSARYCGEPQIGTCEACVKKNGSQLGENISVSALRQRSTAWLEGARRVTVPTDDAAHRLRRYFRMPIQVQPHAGSIAPMSPRTTSRPSTQPRKVAVIGAIGVHKGYDILLACAKDAKARNLPLEFVVIGHTQDDPRLLRTGKVFITGRYSEGEASHLLERERPDVILLPSVWPETWCYALDEALGTGLPIVAFELGAVAERLRANAHGTLVPLATLPSEINDRLLKVDAEPAATGNSNNEMTQKAEEKTMDKPVARTSTPQDPLSASVQILPLPAGLYLFSVKTGANAPDKSSGALQLPAMHVGLGPGVRSDQVEFVAGPSTEGAWLFAKEDCLVTKVKSAGVTLVLTSVRGLGGETLAIKVERLDAREEATPALPAPMAAVPAQVIPAKNGQKVAAGTSPVAESNVSLPLQIGAHIRSRGDMSFTDAPWAGRVAPGLWIESFSVKPLQQFAAGDIEYKGLTGSGFETPWLSDAAMCGTKGMAVPLVGFAIRLKPSRDATAYDCEYSGYFKSGATVGPLRNGAPCRSTVANDPLEGLQVHVRERMNKPIVVAPARPGPKTPVPDLALLAKNAGGPSFGRYRDPQVHAETGAVAATNGSAKTKPTAKPVAKPAGKKPSAPRR